MPTQQQVPRDQGSQCAANSQPLAGAARRSTSKTAVCGTNQFLLSKGAPQVRHQPCLSTQAAALSTPKACRGCEGGALLVAHAGFTLFGPVAWWQSCLHKVWLCSTPHGEKDVHAVKRVFASAREALEPWRVLRVLRSPPQSMFSHSHVGSQRLAGPETAGLKAAHAAQTRFRLTGKHGSMALTGLGLEVRTSSTVTGRLATPLWAHDAACHMAKRMSTQRSVRSQALEKHSSPRECFMCCSCSSVCKLRAATDDPFPPSAPSLALVFALSWCCRRRKGPASNPHRLLRGAHGDKAAGTCPLFCAVRVCLVVVRAVHTPEEPAWHGHKRDEQEKQQKQLKHG